MSARVTPLRVLGLVLLASSLLLAAWAALAWPRAAADSLALARRLAADRRQPRARRLPGPRRRLHGLPHGARRRGLRRRARARHARSARVISPNITPDRATGIGAWSADDFWNALHNGIATRRPPAVSGLPLHELHQGHARPDADALYAYLRSLPPVRQPNQPHELRFPYNRQTALAAWRLLYFKPAVFAPGAAQSPSGTAAPTWSRAWATAAPATARATWPGASGEGLAGGLIPVLSWYAPSLTSDGEAGLGSWAVPDIVAAAADGRVAARPRVRADGGSGQRSLQHLDEPDIAAMAVYLKSLPDTPVQKRERRRRRRNCSRCYARARNCTKTTALDCHGTPTARAPRPPIRRWPATAR